MEEPSSQQLIARCIDGDREAQTLVIERYRTRLLRLAQQGAADRGKQIESDSVVTEVFLRFLQLAQSGRLEWQFEGGLWRLLSRMTAFRVKEKRREAADPRRTAPGGEDSAHGREYHSATTSDDALATALDEFRELLGDYRHSLSGDRSIIFDCWLAGESSLAIGGKTGMTDRNVRRILQSFRKVLSREMNRRLDSPG